MLADGSISRDKDQDTVQEDFEMHTMTPDDEGPSPDAPLIPREPYSSRDGPVGDTTAHLHTNVSRSAGGWFIWMLTLAAGISGLLFGYEYDPWTASGFLP